MRREPGARECNGYSADEEMDGSASREAEEPRALGSANGVKYRRGLEGGGGGGGGNGYHRPMGRGPGGGGEGGYYRPMGRVPGGGGEGGYYRPMWRSPGPDGKPRSAGHLRRGFGREFGRRFDRRPLPGEGPVNGYPGGPRRWKPRPGGREYAGGAAGGGGSRPQEEGEGGRESPASPEEGEGGSRGGGGAGEEREEEERWTLFKPPAAFPVDSSSARTVPRISYASKVKENLSRGGPPTPEAGGPASDDSSSNGGGSSGSEGPAHGLGAIFHNQWGLSFITGPDGDGAHPHRRTGLEARPPDPGPGGPDCHPVHRLGSRCQRWPGPSTHDLQAVVLYFSTEWDQIWERHKQDPSAVVLYEESLDSAGLTD
uniref:uncharacterized protein n=1 Tax=Pristiophorus japonicus TaxID=55135 RepID=UPI00398E4C0C